MMVVVLLPLEKSLSRVLCVMSGCTDICAGVPRTHFASLLSPPFVCIICSQIANESALAELKQEVTALRVEILELRTALVEAQKKTIKPMAVEVSEIHSAIAELPTHSFPDVVKKNVPRTRQSSAPRSSQPVVVRDTRKRRLTTSGKQLVEGARRVWGTMKSCSSAVILGSIDKLTSMKAKLHVRRKSKELSNKKSVWWFIVHGQESVLRVLDSEWEKVQAQTGWTLEQCYMPIVHTDKDQPQPPHSHLPQESAATSVSPLAAADDQHGPTPYSDPNVSCEVQDSTQPSTAPSNSFLGASNVPPPQ